MADDIQVPGAPAGLPEAVEKKWQAAYVRAFKEAQTDEPEQPNVWAQLALKAANKTIRVPKPESIEEALALEDWQIVHRAQKKTKDGDVLVVITRDGSKAAFPVVKSGKKVTASNGAQATA